MRVLSRRAVLKRVVLRGPELEGAGAPFLHVAQPKCPVVPVKAV
jgi:hypothetical protein